MRAPQLNPHQKPPEHLRTLYKHYQKLNPADFEKDPDLVDLSHGLDTRHTNMVHCLRTIATATLHEPLSWFGEKKMSDSLSSSVLVYEHAALPGIQFIPSLLSREVQWQLLSRLLHRDLADERHKTNIHAHYNVPYEVCNPHSIEHSGALMESEVTGLGVSFFNCSPKSVRLLNPLNPKLHKPLTISQFLSRKLRWITLGGQYDWTDKSYPQTVPPAFPEDIAGLIHHHFPDTAPEAAIVNVYSPGDTLSLHRDVSEESDQGLVSISLGCDGIFIVGLDETEKSNNPAVALRLHSGDAVYMSGSSRYAWHGVPQIVQGTCPTWLSTWPVFPDDHDPAMVEGTQSRRYGDWLGWMANKRINLNVRQMRV